MKKQDFYKKVGIVGVVVVVILIVLSYRFSSVEKVHAGTKVEPLREEQQPHRILVEEKPTKIIHQKPIQVPEQPKTKGTDKLEKLFRNKHTDFTCGRDKWQKSYSTFHKQFRTTGSEKYLMYICYEYCGGWGDRVFGMVSAFYFALLTDRIFLIDSSVPVDLMKGVIPNQINWNYNDPDVKPIVDKLPRELLEYVGIQTVNDGKHSLLKENYNEKFKAKVQLVRANQRLYYQLAENPHFAKRRKELGMDRMSHAQVFGCLFHYLFKPSDKVATLINDFYENNFKPSEPIIGVQIRMGGPKMRDDPRIKDEQVEDFWGCISAKSKELQQSKIFLTTDSDVAKERGKKMFNNLVSMNAAIVHIGREEKSDKLEIPFQTTLAEYFILALCDEFIITRSNFAESAVMLSFNRRIKLPQEKCVSFDEAPFEFETLSDKKDLHIDIE